MSYEKLNEKVLSMQEEILEAIRGCVAIDSVKGEAQPEAPYGEGPKAALDYALKLGEKLGFKTGNVGNRVGWAEYGEGEEMVAVLGHLLRGGLRSATQLYLWNDGRLLRRWLGLRRLRRHHELCLTGLRERLPVGPTALRRERDLCRRDGIATLRGRLRLRRCLLFAVSIP